MFYLLIAHLLVYFLGLMAYQPPWSFNDKAIVEEGLFNNRSSYLSQGYLSIRERDCATGVQIH